MRWAALAGVALAVLALAGCGAARRVGGAVVLRLDSPDPAGIEHDPAVAFFAAQVAHLSDGRLRVAVEDYPREQDGSGAEAGVLRAVARGAADLGWAHAASFGAIGVHQFDLLDAPMLIDNYRTEAALIRSELAKRMRAGITGAGLTGLALLAGPLDRLIGASTPLRSAGDIRGRVFALRRSSLADLAVRALGGDPVRLSETLVGLGLYTNAQQKPGQQAYLEDDLDSIFFDRYGGRCPIQEAGCDTSRPWVMTNIVLGAGTEVLVANPDRLRRLSARQRGWLTRAAAAATTHSTRADDQDEGLVPELCAAGVRFDIASPAALASLSRAWRALYARLERGPYAAALRQILALRGGAPSPSLHVPSDCRRRPRKVEAAHGVRSTLPDGVYRIELTGADIRAAGAQGLGVLPGVETLTLRNGHWRLTTTEPGDYTIQGTYAGTPLRTAWFTDRPDFVQESFFSIVVSRTGLRFHVVQSWNALAVEEATYGWHAWRRIGN